MNLAPRIVGIDVARGLAVLGMFGAHIGLIEPFDWVQPGTWTDIVSGRSSILFAVLAGVSIAIISGRRQPASGGELGRVRLRILARAVIIFFLGLLLVALDTGVAVILPYYAVLFVLALPFLRIRPWLLFSFAGVLAIVMPILLLPSSGDEFGTTGEAPQTGAYAVELLATGTYPALVWIVFVLTGLGLGRLDLVSRTVQLRLLVVGVALAVAGYGAGEALAALVHPDGMTLLTTEPHSGSPFEVIGSTGFAIALLALCLLASRVIRRALFPLAAVGSMALSAYTAHIVVIAVIGASVPGETDDSLWILFVIVTLVACSAWRYFLGTGPLERLLTAASRGAARLVPADRLDPVTTQRENPES